jgi:hypothetical protein
MAVSDRQDDGHKASVDQIRSRGNLTASYQDRQRVTSARDSTNRLSSRANPARSAAGQPAMASPKT